MKYIFFSILCALTFIHCKQEQAQPGKSLECYVRFMETESKVQAEASMHQGTDKQSQALEVPGGLVFQGAAMRKIAYTGISYRSEYPAVFQPEFSFEWKDEQQKRVKFDLVMHPVANFGFGKGTLERNQPAVLSWEGDALEKGESLVCLWEGISSQQTISWEIYSSGEKSAIDFPAAKINELSPGLWKLYVVRKKLTKSSAGGVTMSGITEFYSKTDTLNVH